MSSLQHQAWSCAFFHCGICDFIFREPSSFLNWNEQKARYDQHHNSAQDAHYIQYLQKLIDPLEGRLRERALKRGLDWGSGPGPALSEQLRKRGFEMDNYDPLYCPQKPQGPVDFITATEVIEHFQEPQKELKELLQFVSQGGVFAGTTGFHPGYQHFSQWWYARDSTHVGFFSERTLHWLAGPFSLEVLFLQESIFIFVKQK